MKNVMDFGAVGDGVHDDTAAIQAAIDWNRVTCVVQQAVPAGQSKVVVDVIPPVIDNTNRASMSLVGIPDGLAPDTSAGIVDRGTNTITINRPAVGRGIPAGATINFDFHDRGMIFFPKPPKSYTVTKRINLDKVSSAVLQGEGPGNGQGTTIRGTCDDGYVLDRNAHGSAGPLVIRDLYVRNNGLNYGGIRLAGATGGRIENVTAGGRICINMGLGGIRDAGDGTSIVSPGTGYAIGDILQPVGGTIIRPPQIMVFTVDANGGILTFGVIDRGEYRKPPFNPANVFQPLPVPLQYGPGVTGTGSGATIRLSLLGRGGSASQVLDNVRYEITQPDGIGIVMGAGRVSNVDNGGGNIGIVVFGNSCRIENSRLEVHTDRAIVCGVDEYLMPQGIVGLSLDNISFESNINAAIDIANGVSGVFTNLFITAFRDPSRPNPQYGLRLRGGGAAFRCHFAGLFSNGNYDVAAIAIEDSTNKTYSGFYNVTASNGNRTIPGAPGVNWLMPTKATSCSFHECLDGDKPLVPIYTFANLPTGNNVGEGDEFLISDAVSPDPAGGLFIGQTVSSGGGAHHCTVRWNGSNWVVVGV